MPRNVSLTAEPSGHAFAMSLLLPMLPRRTLMALVRGYRLLCSPMLGSSCRFEPSCSAYALQALGQHGATAGTYLTLRRLGRCQPFCRGGHDPVPDHPPRLFRHFVSDAANAPGTLLSTSKPEPLP